MDIGLNNIFTGPSWRTISTPDSFIMLSESTWVTATAVNVTYSFSSDVQNSVWYRFLASLKAGFRGIFATYIKSCADPTKYGFSCNVTCNPPSTGYCYTCDPITGKQICCDNIANIDPSNFFYKNAIFRHMRCKWQPNPGNPHIHCTDSFYRILCTPASRSE